MLIFTIFRKKKKYSKKDKKKCFFFFYLLPHTEIDYYFSLNKYFCQSLL